MTVASKVDFTDRIESLPPLPTVVHRIMLVTGSPETSADEVAEVLCEDQAITAKILRVANSSFFGTGREITQVSRAVVMLGTVGVRNLVLGIAARDAFPAATPQQPEHATLWRHSIATASASELIARQVGYRPSEEAFVAGLLHDIGQLAMATIEPESFDAVFREQGRGTRFQTLERSHFSVDHTQVGFKVLTRWMIPDTICQMALRHHECQLDAQDPAARLLAIVMMADSFAQMMGFGFDMPVGKLERAEIASQVLGLDESEKMRLVGTLSRRIDQAVEMFASVDASEDHREAAVSKRAVWVASDKTYRRSISQLLMEHHGYDVVRAVPGTQADWRTSADLVIIALPEGNAATQLALELVRQGQHKIVLLSDSADGDRLRRRDEETGLCHIPRFFTEFDIQWAERQLGA